MFMTSHHKIRDEALQYAINRVISYRYFFQKQYFFYLSFQSSGYYFLVFFSILEFRIDGTPRLLIIPFLATLPNLIQHSPFINFGEFFQSSILFQTPCLLIHVHSRQRLRVA